MNKSTRIILSVAAGLLCVSAIGHAQVLDSARPKKNADLDDINPNDIASMQILKGASVAEGRTAWQQRV